MFFGDYDAEVFDASGQRIADASFELRSDTDRIISVTIP